MCFFTFNINMIDIFICKGIKNCNGKLRVIWRDGIRSERSNVVEINFEKKLRNVYKWWNYLQVLCYETKLWKNVVTIQAWTDTWQLLLLDISKGKLILFYLFLSVVRLLNVFEPLLVASDGLDSLRFLRISNYALIICDLKVREIKKLSQIYLRDRILMFSSLEIL